MTYPTRPDPTDPADVRRESLSALARVYHGHAEDARTSAERVRDGALKSALNATASVLFALSSALEQAALGDEFELSDMGVHADAALNDMRFDVAADPEPRPGG